MKLVFATNNSHKLLEIRSLLPKSYELLSLYDIGCQEDPPESHDTMEENALEKADFIFSKYGYACFADDSGLEVEALDGKPGVFSARFAGPSKNSSANIQKLLHEMNGIINRRARFKTVIAFINGTNRKIFTGTIEGEILDKMVGNEGFGYDPVFVPSGYTLSFAEMSLSEKNKISHRAKAFDLLISYLTVVPLT